MLVAFGQETHTIFLKGVEAHKLHHEFAVAAGGSVKRAQPVVLNGDGDVVAASGTSKSKDIIGYSIHNGNAGELVTVAMKAFGMVYAMPSAALAAGPVAYDGINTAQPDKIHGFNTPSDKAGDGVYGNYKVAATDGSDLAGWNLDRTTSANELVRVAIY